MAREVREYERVERYMETGTVIICDGCKAEILARGSDLTGWLRAETWHETHEVDGAEQHYCPACAARIVWPVRTEVSA